MGGDFLPASVTFLCCGLKRKEGGAAGTAAPAARRSQPAGWGWGAGSPRSSCRCEPPARRRRAPVPSRAPPASSGGGTRRLAPQGRERAQVRERVCGRATERCDAGGCGRAARKGAWLTPVTTLISDFTSYVSAESGGQSFKSTRSQTSGHTVHEKRVLRKVTSQGLGPQGPN